MLPFLLISCASVFSSQSSFIQNSIPTCFVDPLFSPCLNCLFLFCHASFDCRLALIVSNFLGALRQTHQHLKGKYIIPHYYSSAFFYILPSLRAADTATLLPKPGKDGVSSAYAVLIMSLSNLAVGPLINSTTSQLHQYNNLVISRALAASHSPWCVWYLKHTNGLSRNL